MSVGARIRESREYLGFSVDFVAAESGLEAATVARLEKGTQEPTDLEIRRLGRSLGYPVAYFRDEIALPEDESALAITRWAEQLSENDKAATLRFAEYLRLSALGETDAAN